MTNFSKKVTAIVGTATLAVGLMAFPVLAGTNQQQGNGWVGQMQGFMQKTFWATSNHYEFDSHAKSPQFAWDAEGYANRGC